MEPHVTTVIGDNHPPHRIEYTGAAELREDGIVFGLSSENVPARHELKVQWTPDTLPTDFVLTMNARGVPTLEGGTPIDLKKVDRDESQQRQQTFTLGWN